MPMLYCWLCKEMTHHIEDRHVIICDECGAQEIDSLIEEAREGQMFFNREDHRKHEKGLEEHKCMICSNKFWTALPSPMGEFCQLCRAEWGITSPKVAQDTLEMIQGGQIDLTGKQTKRGVQVSTPVQRQLPSGPVAKVDPAVVAEALRASIDYKVLPVEGWEKPITYVMAKNGLFEVRHSDLATIVTKATEVMGVSSEMKEGITMNLPKLPFLFLQQTISFFREVCKRHKGSSEALVQIWWDRETEAHTVHVPEQTVSGASVNHRSSFDQGSEGRWFHVADIHSHGSSMGAFWSGTDNHDEERVTTERLFGVIGKVDQPIPEWRWRMRTRGGFIDLSMADVFDLPTEKLTFEVSPEILWRAADAKDGLKNGSVVLNCPVEPFSNVEVPEGWFEQVKGYSYNSQHGATHGSFFGQSHLRGFIYVQGREFEVDGPTLKATGHILVPKGDLNGHS